MSPAQLSPVWGVWSFTLVLANAQHIRNVPGRKSDRNDAAWIADLLAHGLIRGSFVPPAPIQELRDLTRTRKQLVREITLHTQRLQKTLEDANVKLTHVVTDILGVSGRAILAAIIAGETDPERLADCTTGRLKAGRADIVAAVHGRVTTYHRFLLELHLAQMFRSQESRGASRDAFCRAVTESRSSGSRKSTQAQEIRCPASSRGATSAKFSKPLMPVIRSAVFRVRPSLGYQPTPPMPIALVMPAAGAPEPAVCEPIPIGAAPRRTVHPGRTRRTRSQTLANHIEYFIVFSCQY